MLSRKKRKFRSLIFSQDVLDSASDILVETSEGLDLVTDSTSGGFDSMPPLSFATASSSMKLLSPSQVFREETLKGLLSQL